MLLQFPLLKRRGGWVENIATKGTSLAAVWTNLPLSPSCLEHNRLKAPAGLELTVLTPREGGKEGRAGRSRSPAGVLLPCPRSCLRLGHRDTSVAQAWAGLLGAPAASGVAHSFSHPPWHHSRFLSPSSSSRLQTGNSKLKALIKSGQPSSPQPMHG